ncbi:S46 family peptidase [Mariniblastus sp.]|nr:S46 family peptidase [bacterium]MDB4460098.1 S46 family peptidase [bacterium]MDC3223427.1 S46 family peptidase [Mariniblastus sp.]
MKQVYQLITFALLSLFATSQVHSDEGMYPISEIARLNLSQKGLQLTALELFNPNETCLIDGICRVNGCTGSFVSPEGLIITNHHCAYRAIQSASSTQNDYLKDGFQAKTRETEIPAAGYTVRVTESFSDVSKQVLSVVNADMSFVDRSKAISRERKVIEKRAEKENPGMRAEVAEMFTGKTYVLFLYTYIKDVRLVFAPPSSIGNFGGDVDNWEWPRHTGDFSFMRAYVAPDGSTADYSTDNVPYKPKRFIQVAPQGANEGDYVMLLGYPGRTARHKTSSFLSFEQDVRLPYIVDLYGRQIATMEKAGEDDRAVALKLLSRIKSLANTEKRSRGQLKGLTRKQIVAKRSAEEQKLQAYIDADPVRKAKYGQLLDNLDSVYKTLSETAVEEANFQNLRNTSQLLRMAFTIYDSAHERQKPDLERESAYMDRNFSQTVSRLMMIQKDLNLAVDETLLAQLIDQMKNDEMEVPALDGLVLKDLYKRTKLKDPTFLQACLNQNTEELKTNSDPFIQLIVKLYPQYLELRESGKARDGQLGLYYGELITLKQQFLDTDFVPDANGTLRLTFGTVRGYSPEDAVYKSPATTLSGVVAKTTGVAPFITPEKVLDMSAKRDFGPYMHPKLKDIPIAILYDTDTTGGNSGSPILNGKGELVGVNFDRAFEATINDFAWNTEYSRSIGVDIRYVLWITDKVYGAKHLIKEMGLN